MKEERYLLSEVLRLRVGITARLAPLQREEEEEVEAAELLKQDVVKQQEVRRRPPRTAITHVCVGNGWQHWLVLRCRRLLLQIHLASGGRFSLWGRSTTGLPSGASGISPLWHLLIPIRGSHLGPCGLEQAGKAHFNGTGPRRAACYAASNTR